jgi:hypothetical protein
MRFFSPSAHQSGGIHSFPGPKTRSGHDLASVAVFRPRRFYGLDGLLHPPLLPGFPRATLMGLLSLQGLPDSRGPRRSRRCLPLLVFPRPALPPQSLSLPPNQRTSRGLLCAPSRSSNPNRPSSSAFGFPTAGTRSLLGFSVGTHLPLRHRLPEGAQGRTVTRSRHVCSELSKSARRCSEEQCRADEEDTIQPPETVQPRGCPHPGRTRKTPTARGLGAPSSMTSLERERPREPCADRPTTCIPQERSGRLGIRATTDATFAAGGPGRLCTATPTETVTPPESPGFWRG